VSIAGYVPEYLIATEIIVVFRMDKFRDQLRVTINFLPAHYVVYLRGNGN
jgi:hypothetical protein